MIEPIEIQVTRHHAYVKTKSGCKVCRKSKHHIDHIGHSDSLNALGEGNRFEYRRMKAGWQEALTLALEASGLPLELDRVFVEGVMCFPDVRVRDQGNHRFIVEKALGDALEKGSWLLSDSWEHYEFGGLAYRQITGESWTRLLLMPTVDDAGVQAVRSATKPGGLR